MTRQQAATAWVVAAAVVAAVLLWIGADVSTPDGRTWSCPATFTMLTSDQFLVIPEVDENGTPTGVTNGHNAYYSCQSHSRMLGYLALGVGAVGVGFAVFSLKTSKWSSPETEPAT